jgi:DUF2950 family protein
MRRAILAGRLQRMCNRFAIISPLLLLGCQHSSGSSIPQIEEAVSAALKTIADAEADFRANDRDHNGANDFWTADVMGLYDHGRLIPRELALADAAPRIPLGRPSPYYGYFFVVLKIDRSVRPPEEYAQVTGNSSAKTGNLSKFAFCAYPANYGKTGTFNFFITEGKAVFKSDEHGNASIEWPPYRQPPNISVLKSDDVAHDLRRTQVISYLETLHTPGTNLIWCSTFQVAWDEIATILKEPPQLEGNPAMVQALNMRRDAKDYLEPSWYVAHAGLVKDGVLEAIRKECEEKFPGRNVTSTLPSPGMMDPSDFIAFSAMVRDLPFAIRLDRHPRHLLFQGSQLHAFGLERDGPTPTPEQLKQIHVLDYLGPEDFVVELDTKLTQDRLILARISPDSTLKATITSALGRIKGSLSSPFQSGDELVIPCLNFDVLRRYEEIEGRFFLNAGFRTHFVNKAWQRIRFRLDEQGALLESEAGIWTKIDGHSPRRLIFDGPFLLLLVKKDAQLPYFAMWIANTEILATAE